MGPVLLAARTDRDRFEELAEQPGLAAARAFAPDPAQQRRGPVDVLLHLQAGTVGLAGAELTEMGMMAAGAGQVRMFSDDGICVHDPLVMRRALELSASAVILVHNHPSGDPTPSQADIQMTKAIIEIASPLGISVHDHIIVGKEGHASFKGLKLI